MEKAYNIDSVLITDEHLILVIDNQEYKFLLSDISEKLSRASDMERNDFRISPSGYGIHWRLLDEDISLNGLFSKSR
ncbi:MAG TPA: DUF2442 domain-containing protein [Bacteroidales bacterium]|nr:DUF2442 domain-containing protein [Bacteroidales bacterium]